MNYLCPSSQMKKDKKYAFYELDGMKSLYLFLAIALGSLIYQAEPLSFLIRYSLMGMLFFSFLDLKIDKHLIQVFHLKIFLANCAMGFMAWGICQFFFPSLATVAFLLGIMPTAIAATVIIGFLKGNTELVVSSVLLTNVGIALLLPWILPLISYQEFSLQPSQILVPILITVFGPLFLAQALRKWGGPLYRWFLPLRFINFYLFVGNVFLASAKASHFIRFKMTEDGKVLLYLVLITWVICTCNFAVGHLVGAPKQHLAGQQSLGRKNTMFGLWIALTFFSPIDALGPICYIFFQNLWNSYQIHKIG